MSDLLEHPLAESTSRHARLSLTQQTTVADDDYPRLDELLAKYGYALRQRNGYLMLAGFLSRKQLDYARDAIAAMVAR